ncbi:MAG: NAD+ synthase [Thermodesulfobacteriota bacterium]|nr:NAD+ synthase [Thermodesulfobacteriota bacterium]
MRTIRIGIAQINTTVGDLEGNTKKILHYIEQARNFGVDLITFPELAITGYPPEDLLLMPWFIKDNLSCLKRICEATTGISAVVGFVDRKDDLYNAATMIHNGELVGIHHKVFLPNYGVFDENRYFQAGRECSVFHLQDTIIGLSICEDIWYPGDPLKTQALQGNAEVIINISASPYHAGKGISREKMLSTRASDNAVMLVFNNLVGGQDELIFDGRSAILDQKGDIICQGMQFEEDLIIADLDLEAVFCQRIHDPKRRKEKLEPSPYTEKIKKVYLEQINPPQKPPIPKTTCTLLSGIEEIYKALTLGVSDYVKKNGFQKVVIGLSGGIDSSLVATIAVDALGKENCIGVAMPSSYSSARSLKDAQKLASNLKIRLLSIPITDAVRAYENMLASEFQELPLDVTEENLQARIRGTILMALSNKFGWLVLTTGNKSETSVGYCTLYGDMAGGFSVIKDVPKMMVYELSRFRNEQEKKELIPASILDKPPSAELRPNQKDTDTLPPYSILDSILHAYVEEAKSREDLITAGFDRKTIHKVISMVDKNEYKRRQAPPGIKITPRAFGKDRRFPITNRYRAWEKE